MLTLYKEEEQTTVKENVKRFLESMLKRENHSTWIVLEATRDEEIKFFLGQYEDGCHYLFNDDDEELQEAGAVALCLQDVPEALAWITEHWGKNWFGFFVTEHDTAQVIAHMSSLCYLSSHDKMYLFRYYEPVTFTCWIGGLKEVKRVNEALGLFCEVYVETPLPHMLMQYTIDSNSYKQRTINLQNNLQGFALPLSKEIMEMPSLDGCWYMGQREYEYLAPVSLNAFKIKLCRVLVEEYALLDTYTLTEVYTIINTEVARATKYDIREKHLVAQLIHIYFENQAFWHTYATNIQSILSQTDMSAVDRIESIFETLYKTEKEHQ